jgi:deoxycytidylate deaminase
MPPVPTVLRGFNKDLKVLNMLSKVAVAVEPVANARLAAALVYKNEIISFGINKKKTHPFQARYGKNKDSIYLHAENDCIKNALRVISVDQLSKCSLYICRVKYSNNVDKKFVYGLAKPCPGCARAIANFDIRNVIYSTDNNKYERL